MRPLLTRSRAELEEWARARDLAWIEDDTNADEQLDRNYLRRSVLPTVRARWPSAAAAVSRSARHAAEARRLINSLGRADVGLAAVGAGLSVQRLRALDPDRRRNALRYWIAHSGFTTPDTRRLDELAGALLDARADAHPSVRWNDTLVERHADVLSIRHGARPTTHPIADTPGVGPTSALELVWRWRDEPRLALAGLGGSFSGPSVARLWMEIVPDPHGPLDLDALPETFVVRGRMGGETIRPGVRARARKLKALLQEARVPPAERATLPLLFLRDGRAKDKLLVAGDRWLDASVQAGGETGARRRARILIHR